MGRTIPSFRLATYDENIEWKEFHRCLGRSDRKLFDRMFSIERLYNSACSYAASPIRIQPIFLSIIFDHYKRLKKLDEQEKSRQTETR